MSICLANQCRFTAFKCSGLKEIGQRVRHCLKIKRLTLRVVFILAHIFNFLNISAAENKLCT